MIKSRQKKNKPIVKNIPPPLQHKKKPGILSSLGESMIMGTGLGLGSEAGHSIFRKVFGENNEVIEPKSNELNCIDIFKMYEKCVTTYDMNSDFCRKLQLQMEKNC